MQSRRQIELGLAVAVSTAMVSALLFLGVRLAASGDEDVIGLEIDPLAGSEVSFAADTHNCPQGPPRERDAEAATLVALIDPVTLAAHSIARNAALRGLNVFEQDGTARFVFTMEGEPEIVSVVVERFTDASAEERITVHSLQVPDPAPSLPDLDLSSLAVGPDAVIEAVGAGYKGSLDEPVAISLSAEGCHLVWGYFGPDSEGEFVLARLNNTTGELKWAPAPFPADQRRR